MKSQWTKERAKKFLSYYKPHRTIFLMDLFFAMLSAVSVLLFPLVSGYLTGEVLTTWNEHTWRRLWMAAAVLLALLAVRVISNIIYAYFGHAMGAKMEERMRQELFQHYEALSFDFHAKNSTGKLMTVLSNDLTSMTELFHHAPEDLLMTVIKFVGTFVIMGTIHLPLTLIVFCALPLLGWAAYRTDRRMERGLLQNKAHLSDLNECAEDTLSGIRTVLAFGREAEHAAWFQEKNRIYTKSKCLFYKVEAYFYETVESYPQFLSMLVVIFGALFITRDNLSPAVLVTFLLYAGGISEPIRTMLNFMRLYEEGKTGFVRFMQMMEQTPAIVEDPKAVTLSDPKGSIEMQDVSFRYPDSKEWVLEHISLRIESGQTVAFAGASGIGKTTLASLIARFYDVNTGSVAIDGVDLRKLSMQSLRHCVGMVQQEVYLFEGTIRENICYGRLDTTEAEMIEAAKLANIHEFIVSLEHGYDSIVGTRGIMLSGGQRQRISIARLFLKNPKILILDEATSALDYESEEIVQQSLERLCQNRTCIVIAHRLSTIRHADQIYVLADHRLVEQGTHEELLQKQGEYARLCQMDAG